MFTAILKVHCIIFLTLVSGIYTYDFYDLDNLGERITEDVNRQLAPLYNLGPRITARVNAQLEPIRAGRFAERIKQDVYQTNYRADDLGDQISYEVKAGLEPLDNLGEQIQQSVYEGLAPVRALEITLKMKDGIGGTTVATHSPEGKKFIIRNNKIFDCSGTIDDDGQCSGTLTPFKVNDNKDYCYFRKNYSIVNNQICIGATLVSVINNVINCKGGLLTTVEEFKKLCRGRSETVEYKYIANPKDPAHVEIPNANKYVKCTNNESGVCVFTESHSFPVISGSSIIINSQN